MDKMLNTLIKLMRSWGDVSNNRENDPDFKAAEEELEEFLRNGKPSSSFTQKNQSFHHSETFSTSFSHSSMDLELKQAFDVLGLPYGSPWPAIKEAHKKLLIKHHPDKHTKDVQSFQQATRVTQTINEAFQKLKKHYKR